jgi:protein-tyrosine kinase
MESIRQAVERAKARAAVHPSEPKLKKPPREASHAFVPGLEEAALREVELDPDHLRSRRIVAHQGKDIHSRPFDMLRTEVRSSMDRNGWKVLAVTSPTPGCGKTLVAVNLALSMARQSDRHVCLVDLDLRKPQVAATLGLKHSHGVLDILEGRAAMEHCRALVRAGGTQLEVIPTLPSSDPSDLVSSPGMKMFLEDLSGHGGSRIVILDLPPLLAGHDVLSILPQVDCVLLVGAVGTSKVSEIEDCNKYLQATNVVRFVLNKAPESSTAYAYY